MPLKIIGDCTIEVAAQEALNEYEDVKSVITTLGRFIDEIGPLLPCPIIFSRIRQLLSRAKSCRQ
jgi:hypothetical protein